MLGQGSYYSLVTGQLGSIFINDTTTHNGQWGIITALADATFTTLTSGNLASGSACMTGTLTSITLKAGQSLFGIFTVIRLAGGAVVAYNI